MPDKFKFRDLLVIIAVAIVIVLGIILLGKMKEYNDNKQPMKEEVVSMFFEKN